jgi:hypothetical protein
MTITIITIIMTTFAFGVLVARLVSGSCGVAVCTSVG